MARYRSRRSSRRSASQSAASLLALALPAPIQRVADTRLGPLLMLVGVPVMLVAGLLQVNWSNGLPTVAVDPQVAADVIQRTRDGYNNLDQQGRLGNLASDLIGGVSNAANQYNYGQTGYPTTQSAQTRVPSASGNWASGNWAGGSSANFPSTQPQSQLNHYTTTPSSTYPATQSSSQASIPWGQSSTHNANTSYPQQQTYSSQQPTYSQPSTYNPSTYAPPAARSQATGIPAGYYQQAASPSDNRNLTQQQLYQQQQYQLQQQQLYEQQLRDQQYRQWLAQQQQLGAQPTSTQQYSSAGQPQYDAYGRPVSTVYSQPTYNYAQPAAQPTRQSSQLPSTQYGQPGYNQGYLPSINSNGRY
ncbi:MAG: hypothetical protein SFV81_20650 [Pirellulaceae bacterium]|nr:hypothetical protein [Pirellulaceae bacterium]